MSGHDGYRRCRVPKGEMMASHSAFLFDVDGTLVDSNDLHAEAWAETFRAFGHDIPTARIRFQIGKGGDNLIPALLPDASEGEREAMDEHRGPLFKRDYLPRVTPFPYVRELFERLAGEAAAIMLASSSDQSDVDHHVEMLGISGLIRGATSRDDAARTKPCPDIFAAALELLGEPDKARVRVVGDSPWDMIAAGRIGLAALGFRCGGFGEADLRAAGASMMFDGPGDMLERW